MRADACAKPGGGVGSASWQAWTSRYVPHSASEFVPRVTQLCTAGLQTLGHASALVLVVTPRRTTESVGRACALALAAPSLATTLSGSGLVGAKLAARASYVQSMS